MPTLKQFNKAFGWDIKHTHELFEKIGAMEAENERLKKQLIEAGNDILAAACDYEPLCIELDILNTNIKRKDEAITLLELQIKEQDDEIFRLNDLLLDARAGEKNLTRKLELAEGGLKALKGAIDKIKKNQGSPVNES